VYATAAAATAVAMVREPLYVKLSVFALLLLLSSMVDDNQVVMVPGSCCSGKLRMEIDFVFRICDAILCETLGY
jgi:hypothetical protein